MSTRRHVSDALFGLRRGVIACAAILIVSLLIQMLVFGFVHFTEVRWVELQPKQTHRDLVVIRARPGTIVGPPAGLDTAGRSVADMPEPPDLTRVASRWEVVLARASGLASTAGTVAAALLALMTLLGVVVAAGAAVPGVDRVVSAALWSTALAIMAFPLHDILPSIPFPGLLTSYEALVSASDAAAGRTMLSAVAAYVALPLVAVIVTGLILFRFMSGVQQGLIVTSVSYLDEMLEREMRRIRQEGVLSNVGPRTIGVLDRAVGDPERGRDDADPADPSTGPARTAARRDRGRSWVAPSDRRISDPDPGNPLKRPI